MLGKSLVRMQNINLHLISAVREGRLESTRELISSFGPSYQSYYSPALSDGYGLLCEALENKHAEVVKLLLTNGTNVNTSKKPSDTPLHFAVINGDIEIVKIILEKGANIEAENRNGRTPLYDAIKNKKIEVTEFLLKHKARVNNRDNDGMSPLHVAVEIGCLQIIEHLLKYGADINCVCTSTSWKKGYTPLHCAVENGSKEVVTILLSGGAHVDVKAEDNITPLHIAASKGYICIAEDLLNRGACTHSLTMKEGYMPLHFASELGNEDGMKLFLNRGADINASTKGNLTPLSIATKAGHNTVVKVLLEHGAKVDNKDKDGKTVLHLAAEKGNIEIVKLLLQHGAKIDNYYYDNGKTVLHFAVENGNIEIVKLLLQLEAKLDNMDDNGKTVLHLAVENENIEIVKLLLQHGAKVNNYFYNFGKTVLHLAVENGNIEIVKLLLQLGAKVDKYYYNTGKTALHLAVENGNIKIVKLLLQHGAKVDNIVMDKDSKTALHLAVEKGNIEIAKLLLQNGAKVDNEDEDGKTVLYHTVNNGCLMLVKEVLKYFPDINNKGNRSCLGIVVCPEIVEALLKYGFIVKQEDTDNPKLLHAAVKNGHLKIIKDLFEFGADVNMLFKCFTPLHTAAKNKQEEAAKLLINYEADINARDKTRKTPIFYAIENADLKITKLLLTNGANIKDSPELLNTAVKKQCMKIVKTLLKFDAINFRDAYGRTALHIASQEGHIEVVATLLEYGSDINITSRNNHTALNHAQDGFECAETVKAFRYHIIKMKTANLYVSEKNLQSLHDSDGIYPSEFQEECEKEIASMRSELINDTGISFYDILAKDPILLEMYMRNENTVQVLKSEDNKIKFPIYAGMIANNFRKAMERKELLEQSHKIFQFFVNNFPELPYDCTEKILSYLISNKDLQIFVDAGGMQELYML